MRPPQQGHCWTCSVAASSSASGSVAGTASKLASLGDHLGFGSAGEQAVVADAVEALRQDVQQEAADELAACQASWSCSGLVPRSGSP